MKNSFLIFLFAAVLLSAGGIPQKITVTSIRDLEANDVIVSSSARTVVISPAETDSDGNSCKCTADGTDGRDFTASFQNSSITVSGSGGSFTVNNFLVGDGSTSGTTYSSTFPAGSAVTLYAGATFNIPANQSFGAYTGTNRLLVRYDGLGVLRQGTLDFNISIFIGENVSITEIRHLRYGIYTPQNLTITIQPQETNTQGQSAKFSIEGMDGQNFTASLQSSSVTLTTGTNNLTADTFRIGDGSTSGTTYTGTLPVGGPKTIYVGGRLRIRSNSQEGNYQGTNTLIVNYL